MHKNKQQNDAPLEYYRYKIVKDRMQILLQRIEFINKRFTDMSIVAKFKRKISFYKNCQFVYLTL